MKSRTAHLPGLGFIIGAGLLLVDCGGAAPTASSPAPASPSSTSPASASAATSAAALSSSTAKPGAAASVGASGAASIPQRWFDVVNTGDTNALGTLFTDGAVFVDGPPCNIRTSCKGLAGVTRRVQTAANAHTQDTLPSPPTVVGNLVQWRTQERNDTSKSVGVDHQFGLAQATLRGDKVALYVSFVDLSDADSAKQQTYAQQQIAASASAKPASSGTSDPATVVTRWNDAINNGDAAAAASLWTPDAVMGAGGAPCAAATPCTGSAILARFQGQVALHVKYTLVGTPYVAGNMVQMRREIRNDNAKAAGVDRFVDWHQEMIVGDKIASDIGWNDITDAQTVKYTEWQQAQANTSAAAKPAGSAAASPKP